MKKGEFLGSLFLSLLLGLILYIVLHEGGHAIVMTMCGEKIVTFSVVDAYVSGDGSGEYNVFTKSLMSSAGMLLPVIAAILYACFYKVRIHNIFYTVFSAIFCTMPLMSLLAWIAVPFTYMAGNTSSNDDIIKVLNESHIPPLALSFGSMLLFIGMAVFLWKKSVIKSYLNLARSINKKD